MEIPEELLNELKELRKSIHREPELSGNENATASRIVKYLSAYNPDEIVTGLGGSGVAAVFRSKEPGPEIMIRCELDALPINEINDFEYKSTSDNISHKCGHDGHMTIVAGLAPIIADRRIFKGSVILLFQPAEETGEGAALVIKDKRFEAIKPDYIFALHNLPGFPINSVVMKNGIFAAASKGMIIKLKGKTSHAAEPEHGINPAAAVAKIIQSFNTLISSINNLKDFSLLTIIHVKLGEKAFGTSPGYAEVMATLRAYRNEDMDLITQEAVEIAEGIAAGEKLEVEIDWTEEFPATVNEETCAVKIRAAAKQNDLKVVEIDTPFKWSEDFGHFTNLFKGALFGIGSGEGHPDLHNPDYDFPDEIIGHGINMFFSIIKTISE
jgi:amidohydrolase